MNRFEKADAIGKELFEFMPEMDGLERMRLVRRWMAHPFAKFIESMDAGYCYPEGNPVTGTLEFASAPRGT